MNRSASSRRGWSLIELVVALAVGAVLMGLVTVLLMQVTRKQNAGDGHAWEPLALGLLADRFRADVYQSITVEGVTKKGHDSAGEIVRCHLFAGRDVVYQLNQDRLLRQTTTSDGQPAQARFRLPRSTKVEMALSSEGRETMATLVLRYPVSSAANAKRRELGIAAMVGRDLRWRRVKEERKGEMP